MLGLFTRFVARLPVGRKLLLIYLLDLSAVIYISGILINEKYIAINFARKEVAGNLYIAEIRDTLSALAVPIIPSSGGPASAPLPPDADLNGWITRLERAESQHGPGMASEDASAALIAAVRAMRGKPSLDTQRHEAVKDAARALITRVGNQSNLILDPDLDSYYTMSLLVLRFPELQDVMARTASKTVELALSSGERHAVLLTETLILEGRLDAAIKGMQSDYAEALAAGPPSLRQMLEPGYKAMFASLEHYGRLTGHLGTASNPMQSEAMAALHALTLQPVLKAWQQTGSSMDTLLQARIHVLLQRMWLHLGTAVGLLMVILAVVYFVARQISRPIHSLADVADEVSRSGDYSKRAKHDSGDEIGKLVLAFNSMLGQLDRERGNREELAATARAQHAQRALLESFPTPLIVTSIPDHEVLHANQPALSWLVGQQTGSFAGPPQERLHPLGGPGEARVGGAKRASCCVQARRSACGSNTLHGRVAAGSTRIKNQNGCTLLKLACAKRRKCCSMKK